MLDQAEKIIAQRLADHHYYPFGTEIYLNIFRHFSHFPLPLRDLDTDLPGESVTYLALVVYECLSRRTTNFLDLYESVLAKYRLIVADYAPEDRTVETFLGCILFYYHCTNIRSALLTMDVNPILKPEYHYEYELKKRTILIHVL